MQNDTKRTRLRVTGRVQGVGFRWFVASEARRLGLMGWVRNNADGSVELETEGAAGQIEMLLARVRKGPPAARVDEVAEIGASDEPLPVKFETRR
jgi:acylphosphatase